MSYYREIKKNDKQIKKLFLERVKKERSCWIWKGSTTAEGHGQISLGFATLKAHRLSYLLYKGELAAGKRIFQTCENKLCVNPKHQRILVSKKEQKKLEGSKNTQGSNNGNSKLRPKDIQKIRKLAKNHSIVQIATRFDVSSAQIGRILSGKNWSHV
ncbi:MAG: hypothetical protein KDK39_09485 [Leptospiraceae bacterium]|nr:hypothetical protein [Leptospiraceae bacterium]